MPRIRKYADDAARVKAHREKHQLVTLSVDLPADVVEALNDYMKFKGISKTAVIEKLIRSQLLRKR